MIFKEDLEEIFGVRKWGEIEKATFNSFSENGDAEKIAPPVVPANAAASNESDAGAKVTKETLA